MTHVKIGSQKSGKHLTRLSNSSRSARQRRPWRERTIPWTTPSNFTPLRMDFRPHPSRERMTGRPGRRKTRLERTNQPPHPSDPMRNPVRLCRIVRCNMAFIEPMHRNKPNIIYLLCRLVCRWWFDPPGPTAHLGLGSLIAIVDTVMIVVTKIIIGDRPDVMGRPGPSLLDVTRPGAMRVVNGHAHRLHREGPAPNPGHLIIIILRGLRLTTGPCPYHWSPTVPVSVWLPEPARDRGSKL